MQRDRWHLGLLAREAIRNVFGAGSRMLAILALAILAGAGSSAYIALETQIMRQEIHDLAAEGRNVLVFSALNNDAPARITRASCEVLAGQHGIRHAGMLEHAGELEVLPVGSRLPTQRASMTLFPELAEADLLVGRTLSERAARPFIVRTGQDLATAVHADRHPGGLGTGSSITLPPRPSDVTTERCVVVLDEFSDAGTALPAVAAQLKVTENSISGSELLTATSDPVADYLQRPSRWLPLLLGLFGAIATAVTTRLRASEFAVYRMSGTSPVSVMTLLTLEALLIAGTAALSATAASLALAPHHLDPTIPILWGLALAGTWALSAVASSLDLAVRRPSDLAKDR
ncbi:hypothetical protein [Pseudactinotalea sp. HY158]|uniref:hypothetical protein n=1 Tax=Pseudactinotalea sp. HY158 TaxID=2654547 RepID=UPI00129C2963|nr:hypothetical protein [Pseudactinotalea sp. HY158]QGH69172.1 hypothetical protein GCE65_06355 [Pseudactinotalea sp. HY158]